MSPLATASSTSPSLASSRVSWSSRTYLAVVNGPGSVGGCSEAVKSPCRLSIWKGMSDVPANPPKRQARWGLAVVLLALLTPPGTLLLLRSVPSLDVFLRSAVFHLVVVAPSRPAHWRLPWTPPRWPAAATTAA